MSLTFSVPDSVLSTTVSEYAPTMADNIFTSIPLLYFLVGRHEYTPNQATTSQRGALKVIDGGYSIVEPLMYAKNSTAGSYSGYDLLDTTPQEGLTAAQYNWKENSVSITISGKELRQNNGKNKIIDLLKTKTMQAEMSLMDEINRQLVASTGTDTSKDMLGLGAIINSTGTIGQISGSTNTWWQSYKASSVGSFATGGIAAMRTGYNTISRGNDHPDLLLSDQSTFEYYEKALQLNERFTDSKLADGGFQTLLFKNVPMMFDNNTYFPSGTIYMINSKYLQLQMHTDANFTPTDFVKPSNQDAKVAQVLVMGEFTTNNRARLGILSGIVA